MHWPFSTISCRELPASVKALRFLLTSGSLPKGCYLCLAQPISLHLNQGPLQHINSPPPLSLLSPHFVPLCHSGLITHHSRLFSIHLGQYAGGNSCPHPTFHQACFTAIPATALTASQQLIPQLMYSNSIANFTAWFYQFLMALQIYLKYTHINQYVSSVLHKHVFLIQSSIFFMLNSSFSLLLLHNIHYTDTSGAFPLLVWDNTFCNSIGSSMILHKPAASLCCFSLLLCHYKARSCNSWSVVSTTTGISTSFTTTSPRSQTQNALYFVTSFSGNTCWRYSP